MDLAKALGILGFNSTRWLDMSSGLSPKQELDKAHFEKMVEITMKWKILAEGQQNLECSEVWFINLKICTVHARPLTVVIIRFFLYSWQNFSSKMK